LRKLKGAAIAAGIDLADQPPEAGHVIERLGAKPKGIDALMDVSVWLWYM